MRVRGRSEFTLSAHPVWHVVNNVNGPDLPFTDSTGAALRLSLSGHS